EEARLAQGATAASELLSEARTRLATARSAASIYAERQQEGDDAANRKSEAAAAIEPAAARARAASGERDAASSALEGVRRAHAPAMLQKGVRLAVRARYANDRFPRTSPCPVRPARRRRGRRWPMRDKKPSRHPRISRQRKPRCAAPRATSSESAKLPGTPRQ